MDRPGATGTALQVDDIMTGKAGFGIAARAADLNLRPSRPPGSACAGRQYQCSTEGPVGPKGRQSNRGVRLYAGVAVGLQGRLILVVHELHRGSELQSRRCNLCNKVITDPQ